MSRVIAALKQKMQKEEAMKIAEKKRVTGFGTSCSVKVLSAKFGSFISSMCF